MMGDEPVATKDLTYRVSEDAQRVLVSGRLPVDDPAGAVAQLLADLRERKIVGAPSAEELLASLASNADPQGYVADAEIVRGTPPEPSRDGEIVWARDFFAAGFVEDAAGGVDFWQRRGNPSVGANDAFATVIEPRKGVDGRDVYGTKLLATAPAPLKLRPGANVRVERLDDDRQALIATVDGRLRLASGQIAVDYVLTVNTVGVETGHIVHRGAVVVKGDVEPGSRIEAGGDCEVRGSVEQATLIVGGSLTVRGGLFGRGEEPSRVAGHVRTKFIIDTVMDIGEGLQVESEIAHCHLRCRGSIQIPKGRIVAGDVAALGGMTVGVAGGEGRSRTVLTVGRDHLWETEVAAREEEIRKHEHNRARIQSTVSPLLENEQGLSPSQREAATELLARAAEMAMTIEELRGRAAAFAADSRARAVPRVAVLQRGRADTLFVLPEGPLLLEEDREGPFHVKMVHGKLMALPGAHDADERVDPGPRGRHS